MFRAAVSCGAFEVFVCEKTGRLNKLITRNKQGGKYFFILGLIYPEIR
jgi:hypothetical protein